MIYSILWLGFCLAMLVPYTQTFFMIFIDKYADTLGKNYSAEKIESFFKGSAFVGIGFYAFSLLLIAFEKLIIKQNRLSSSNWKVLFLIITTLLAAAIRISGFNQINGDIVTQISWTNHFRENGFFNGFRTFPGNYNAVYLYILSILSFLPVSAELYLMKAISCVFDFICAYYSMRIMFCITKNKKISLLAYAIILFSPTVFLNSGFWAQSESMYAAFIMMSLYYLLINKVNLSMIFFGISLSFKLQAVFPLPFIIFYFIYYKISVKKLLFIFVGIISVSIPAWIFGWPVIRIIINYIAGTNTGVLTWNAPTIFAWPGDIPSLMPVVFITFLLFCLGFLVINKKSVPSYNTLLLLFIFCNLTIPFFLPNMHERYFFVGEIAVLLYSIANPKRLWISFPVIIPALATYSNFLWLNNPFPLVYLSLVILSAVVITTKWLIESIIKDQASVK